ncbi:hypothetical protein BH20ACT6_BH20ACT6_01070 [soil metagenome]
MRETACLTSEHRGRVDAELAALPGSLAGLGDRATVREARRIAYRLDPHAVTNRAAKAIGDRRVTLRPAPETMGLLTGLLPVQQAVAAYASLTKHADAQRAAGDERGRGQIMSDTYFERLTGLSAAEPVPITLGLVMTDHTLLGGGMDPAELAAYGPIPAPLARQWLRNDSTTDRSANGHDERDDRLEDRALVWLRRLYTTPAGRLGAVESTQRRFDGNLRRFVIIRDRTCRPPWCDAPIRHVDHPVPMARGGQTSAANSKACARRATTPRRPSAGAPDSQRAVPSRPPRPPGTST